MVDVILNVEPAVQHHDLFGFAHARGICTHG